MNLARFTPSLLLLAASLHAASDWIPRFEDEPVAPALAQAIDEALPSAAIVAPKKERRVLVFSATQGFRHRSIPAGKRALEAIGRSTGAFETVISDHPEHFEREALSTFDAVVLLSPTMDFFLPNPKERELFSAAEWAWLEARHTRLVDNLVAYVEQGGGLIGIHAATDSCYGHEAYGETIGAYFDGHPWRQDTRVTIVVEDPGHGTIQPVFAGMDDFELVEEIYQYRTEPYSREKLRILLHLDPSRSDEVTGMKRADGDYPVAWVQAVGKGRVFYTNIGHNKLSYAHPLILKHFLAGIQFATGDLAADTTPSASRSTGEWQSLFDGETLEGWTQRNGSARYEVREGAIVGRSVLQSPNSFLCTDREYGDFELEFEVRCGAINSGVQIRSLPKGGAADGRIQGPQIEIEHSPGQSGYVYGEAYSRSWRSPEPKSEDPAIHSHQIFKNDAWNHYRIRAQGPRIQTWINGEPVADLHDPESYTLFPRGMIGLQVHSHDVADIEIEWRKLRLREIK